jgi:hypothetical protein
MSLLNRVELKILGGSKIYSEFFVAFGLVWPSSCVLPSELKQRGLLGLTNQCSLRSILKLIQINVDKWKK